MPQIYDELRGLAARCLRSERAGHTLQATALVHEAYLRLARVDAGCWENRVHFRTVAAQLIRRILVQHARSRRSIKRGHAWRRAQLDLAEIACIDSPDDILAVNDALAQLAELDPDKARLVELRFFSGLTIDEIAEALGISPRTAARSWSFARAWLARALRGDDDRSA